jgi:Fe-S cluster biosynthesis and repair protein YggX
MVHFYTFAIHPEHLTVRGGSPAPPSQSDPRADRPRHDVPSRARLATTRHNRSMTMCGGPPGVNPEPVGNQSGRKVFCVKFQQELPGLDAPPWPGEIGQRIYDKVSAQAWKLWEDRQKMILNEYRLMPWQKEAQELILKHMEDFFFGEGAALPPGYVPQQSKG